MKRIPRSQALVTALDATLRPALTVAAGERFAVGTEDASHGLLRYGDLPPTPESTPYARHAPGRANPVGGPVHVEGVRAGACVHVDIVSIELADVIADRVWRTRSQLELAVVEYIGWYNAARLHESLGDIPPAEYEQLHPLEEPITLVGATA